MRVELYNLLTRRTVLKGSAAFTAMAVAGCGEEKKEEQAAQQPAAPAETQTAATAAPASDLRKQLPASTKDRRQTPTGKKLAS
jgi:anaerobic selenocysteine-containing dehydrogenase